MAEGGQKSPPNKLSPSQGAEQGPMDWEHLSLAQQMLLESLGLVTVVSHHKAKRSYCHLASRKWAQRRQS